MIRPIEKLGLRAFKPFFIFYYRFLFGRRFPYVEKISEWVLWWERRTGRKNIPMSRESWESEYRDETWSFLWQLEELARYSVIAGILHHLRPGGSVLDVGCGEGVLLEKILPYGISRYTGIDVSEVAIERCAARKIDNASFAVADAERFTPAERFDAIVFNECLYYFHDPIKTVKTYQKWLNEQGILLVAQFKSRRAAAIAKRLKEELPFLGETLIANRKGTWILDLFGERLS